MGNVADTGKRTKAAIWVALLTTVCGLVLWHAVSWHSSGKYLEMIQWLETGRGYLTALYNLGLMLVMGALLGRLMQKISDLLG
ncbi:MAG: hypothetical protein HY528_04955 [Chloroflexi bacterium]|nr:hypothetical protein [Chloroflexota bacterium]